MPMGLISKKDLLCIIFIILLCLIFFSKVILNPTKMISPSYDLLSAYSPWKFFIHQSYQQYKQIPLWYNQIFSGIPLLGSHSGAVMMFYPANILFLIFTPEKVFGWLFIFHTILAGVTTYLFLRIKKISEIGASIGAISFMFSGVLVSKIFVGHLTNMIVISLVPCVFLSLELLFKKKNMRNALFFGIMLALQYHASMIQYFFYSCFVLLIYTSFFLINDFIKRKNKSDTIKLISYLTVSLVLFLGLTAIHLLPAIEYSQYTTRNVGKSYEFSVQDSFEPRKLITFVLPNFFGTPATNTDWGGGDYWEVSTYFGVLTLVLSLLGIFFSKNKTRLIYILLILFSLLVALGRFTPFYSLVYNFIPGFNFFRIPASILFVYVFSMVVLAGYGADYIRSKFDNISNKQFFEMFCKLLIVFGFITLITTPMIHNQSKLLQNKGWQMLKQSEISDSPSAKPDAFYHDKINKIIDQIIFGIAKLGALVLLIGILFTARLKQKLTQPAFLIILFGILIADLWVFGMPLIWQNDTSALFAKTDLVEFLEKDTSLFRVLDTSNYLPHWYSARYNLNLITGYDPFILHYYVELTNLIGNYSGYSPTELPMQEDPNFDLDTINNFKVLDMLSVKYLISDTKINHSRLKLVYNNSDYTYLRPYGGKEYIQKNDSLFVYENTKSLPFAYVVSDIKVIPSKEETLVELNKLEYDSKETVILNKGPGLVNLSDGFKDALIEFYSPNKIIVSVNLTNPGLLVLSEIWYPGWKAYDNGMPIQVYKANHALRSVYLHQGNHTVEFIYEPTSYKIGKTISLITVLGLLLVFVRKKLSFQGF